jgi:hypothetical protein
MALFDDDGRGVGTEGSGNQGSGENELQFHGMSPSGVMG